MKILIDATSNIKLDENTIIEVESIDEAIHKLQTDRDLVKSVVDNRYTYLEKGDIPSLFVIDLNETDEYDACIEIYDSYRE